MTTTPHQTRKHWDCEPEKCDTTCSMTNQQLIKVFTNFFFPLVIVTFSYCKIGFKAVLPSKHSQTLPFLFNLPNISALKSVTVIEQPNAHVVYGLILNLTAPHTFYRLQFTIPKISGKMTLLSLLICCLKRCFDL